MAKSNIFNITVIFLDFHTWTRGHARVNRVFLPATCSTILFFYWLVPILLKGSFSTRYTALTIHIPFTPFTIHWTDFKWKIDNETKTTKYSNQSFKTRIWIFVGISRFCYLLLFDMSCTEGKNHYLADTQVLQRNLHSSEIYLLHTIHLPFSALFKEKQ